MSHEMRTRCLTTLALLLLQLPNALAAQLTANANLQATGKTGETNSSRLPEVHLDGGYFTRNGKRFIPVGAHWVPAKAAMQWPLQWIPKISKATSPKCM